MIRPAEPSDYAEMDAVFRASAKALCAGFYASETIEGWAGEPWPERFQLSSESGDDIYVHEQDSRIICFGAINVEKQLLESLFVHPAVAGTGVGQKMLDFLVSKAREGGVKTLHLVSSLNAANFYARNGFVETGREQFQTKGGVVLDSVRMKRVLRT